MKKTTFQFQLRAGILIVLLLMIVWISFSSIKFRKNLAYQQLQAAAVIKAEKDAKEKLYLTGRFEPAERSDFVLVDPKYVWNGINSMYLRKEAYEAFVQMESAASAEDVDLKLVSATRNFEYQRSFWDAQWSGNITVNGQNIKETIPDEEERFNKILEYSAVPGTSRHHWGTDIDINKVNPTYFNGGRGEKEYEWMVNNAASYGFCQTYIKKGDDAKTGYHEEKWHWSYMPLSRIFLEEYKTLIKDEDIKDFYGEQYVPIENLIQNYVLNINPDCI